MSEAHRWLATALKKAEALVTDLRETGDVEDDWLDERRDLLRDVFRDLAVALRLSSRSVDWEGRNEKDPLDCIRAAKPIPKATTAAIITALATHRKHFVDPERPDKSFVMVRESSEAIRRVRIILRTLLRAKKSGSVDDAKEKLEELLEHQE